MQSLLSTCCRISAINRRYKSPDQQEIIRRNTPRSKPLRYAIFQSVLKAGAVASLEKSIKARVTWGPRILQRNTLSTK